jgi:hypothetical protein
MDEAAATTWETQEDVDACLRETGVTPSQMSRWRHEGLLAPAKQDVVPYRGSTVRYPSGTCAQIRAAQALFRKKDLCDYVGLHLWRQGFPVSEKYWRPRLKRAGRRLDKWLPIIARVISRFERENESETFQDRAAQAPVENVIYSRIKRRLPVEELAIFLRIPTEIATGKFTGFEPSPHGERSPDDTATIKALDFRDAEKHAILGQQMNFAEVLPSALQYSATAFRAGLFFEAANAPTDEIALARDDVLNALKIGQSLYDGLKWIYGERAFGLRFVAWFARKAPDPLIDVLILPALRLRAIPGAILPSDQIAAMAKQALAAETVSHQLQQLWLCDPRYKAVLSPKRIRAAFNDKVSLERWQTEVRSVSVSGVNIVSESHLNGLDSVHTNGGIAEYRGR